MSSMKTAVFCLLAATALASSVKVLTNDNFSETISNNENVIVEFFAPWCGHCKSLAPHYEKAAATLAAENIVLASVDATVYGELAGQFDVKGYPTLKVFKNGVASEYKGGRTEETIVTYARKIFGPAASPVSTAEELTDAQGKGKVVVVGFFAEQSGPAFDAFIAHAKTDQDIPYFYSTSSSLAADNGVTVPGVKLFKQFDELSATFNGELSQEAIASFVASNSVPLVIPFSMESVQDIFGSKIGRVAFLFRTTADAANLDALYKEIATAFRGLAVFVTADFAEPRLNQYLGVEAPGPHFIFAETPQGGALRRFPLEGEITAAALTQLLTTYKSGELKPTLKSDPIPAANNGPVTVVVGKNFNDIVMDETKDVLLEVYAPWCGHCKKLEPLWNELGTAFSGDSSIVIAKMDGTTNEVDGLVAQGFPTILFYPAGSKTPAGVAYNGGREMKDFKEFLASNRKTAGHDHSGHDHSGHDHHHHHHDDEL